MSAEENQENTYIWIQDLDLIVMIKGDGYYLW
jgi:hypothetical protein